MINFFLFQVLWFAPSQGTEAHNFYGNVSFVIDWSTLLNEVGPNLYLIDQAINKSRCFTRVLLTNKIHPQLELLSLFDYGSVVTMEFNSYFHISEAQCIVRPGPHELQVGVECDDRVARRLFELCSVHANNHSHANILAQTPRVAANGKENIYQSYKCFRYNTAMGEPCPDTYSIEETENELSSMKDEHNQRSTSTYEYRPSAMGKPKPSTQHDHSTKTYASVLQSTKNNCSNGSEKYVSQNKEQPKRPELPKQTSDMPDNVTSNSAQNSTPTTEEGLGARAIGSIISAFRYFVGKAFG